MRVNKEVAYIFLDAILLIIILLISGRRWSRPTLRSLLHSDKTMFSINRLFNQSVRCSGKKPITRLHRSKLRRIAIVRSSSTLSPNGHVAQLRGMNFVDIGCLD